MFNDGLIYNISMLSIISANNSSVYNISIIYVYIILHIVLYSEIDGYSFIYFNKINIVTKCYKLKIIYNNINDKSSKNNKIIM